MGSSGSRAECRRKIHTADQREFYRQFWCKKTNAGVLEELGFKAVLKEKEGYTERGRSRNAGKWFLCRSPDEQFQLLHVGKTGAGKGIYRFWTFRLDEGMIPMWSRWHWHTWAGDHLSGCRDKKRTAGCTGACDPPKDKNYQRYSDDAGEHLCT